MIAIFVIFGIVIINTNLAFATNSKNVYGVSVGGREFVVSYDISNATVNEILVKKNLSYTNHYWYSLMITIDNSTTSSGELDITLPLELMASTCQSGFYPKVSINNGTFNDANEISSTKTNEIILIKLPPFTKNIGIVGYGPDPSSGCPTFAYNMTSDGKTYWIDYKSNPEIHDFSMDKNGSFLVATLSHLYHFPPPQPGSYADIQIPRNLLDSKMGQSDRPFTVMVDGNMTQIQEIETTNTTRTIHVPLRGGLYSPDNGGRIIITGTTPTPEFPSPLQQLESGIASKDVHCKEGLQLVIKSEDGSPACVTDSGMGRMTRQGWWAWNDKVGNTLVNTPDKKDFDNKKCGILETTYSIVGTNDFAKDDLPKNGITYPGENLASLEGSVIQFAIKPNSTSTISFAYDFNQFPGSACKVTTKDVIANIYPVKPNATISDLLSSPDVIKVEQTRVRTDLPLLGNSGDIQVKLINGEDLNDHVVKVTYQIISKPNAQIGKSYFLGFWWHSAVVVTVGNDLYNGTALSGPGFS